MLNNRVLPAFSQWVQQVELFKRADYLMRKVMGQLLHGLTGSGFRSWCGVITQMKQEEHEAQLEKCRQLEAQLQERGRNAGNRAGEDPKFDEPRRSAPKERRLTESMGALGGARLRPELMRKVVGQLLHGLTGCRSERGLRSSKRQERLRKRKRSATTRSARSLYQECASSPPRRR